MITQPELETLESNALNIAQMRLLLLFCEAIRRNLTSHVPKIKHTEQQGNSSIRFYFQ